jgi:hypothetical protein
MFAIGRVTTQSKKRNLLSKSDIARIAPKSNAVIATINMIKAIRKRGAFTATSWCRSPPIRRVRAEVGAREPDFGRVALEKLVV